MLFVNLFLRLRNGYGCGNVLCICGDPNKCRCDGGITPGDYPDAPTKWGRSGMFVPDDKCICEDCTWFRKTFDRNGIRYATQAEIQSSR